MPRYLVTVMADGNPLRTRDVPAEGRSAWQVGWLYRHLNPSAKITAIRLVPEGR
jgi:phage gp29-like protein